MGIYLFLADGEGFEPPVELPPQRFSRPPHSTALPPIRNSFYRRSFNLRFTFSAYNYNLSDILFQAFYSYTFFLIEYKNKPNPHANIIPDNNCPIVSPQLVKKPIWISGARNCSQPILNIAYNIPSIPPSAPG